MSAHIEVILDQNIFYYIMLIYPRDFEQSI